MSCGMWRVIFQSWPEDYILAAHLYRHYVNLCARMATSNAFNILFLLVAHLINLTMNFSKNLSINNIEISLKYNFKNLQKYSSQFILYLQKSSQSTHILYIQYISYIRLQRKIYCFRNKVYYGLSSSIDDRR